MRVIFDINTKTEYDTLTALLNNLNINNVNVTSLKNSIMPGFTKGNNKIDVSGLFGIWSNNPQTLQELRKKEWTRNENI